MMKETGLALGAGGARGLSQIGVLLWLKENGFKIGWISGTSIGSILGAATASGYSPEYLKEIALSIRWTDALRYLRPSLKGKSFLEWGKLDEFIGELFGDKHIEDLKIPFACVATDIDTGREHVFRSGKVTEALRASACIPAVFPAVEMEGVHLVDGSVVNPVPINIAFELGAEKVVGVNVNPSVFTERMESDSGQSSHRDKIDGWIREILERNPLVRRGVIDTSGLEERLDRLRRRRNIVDVVTDTVAITSSRILTLQLMNTGPLLLIRPDVGGYQDFDFDRAKELIELGYNAAAESGDDLREFCS
jgi:NTE family protein